MLTHPFVSFRYEPQLSYLLAGISIYDKEETLGEALWVYDPNKQDEREEVIKKFIIPNFEYLTYRHRFLIFKMLESFLQKSDFDFSTQFQSDYEDPRIIAWDETEIENPRGFFEDIYRFAAEEWKADLKRASEEDQTTW
ncbi:hypothetical protein [Pseudomonas fluorescens]|uniref:Uncharacterized protein n=1 Tax=Pseudomonas fluorescens TaxID=294 RepID=A0A5E7N6L6_PSEFL|nr:hypothetical protein [Pseudomonas fluorescens]VVP31963.1 hypothetical protein PS854_04355 [Pseudomonas fluorescens]